MCLFAFPLHWQDQWKPHLLTRKFDCFGFGLFLRIRKLPVQFRSFRTRRDVPLQPAVIFPKNYMGSFVDNIYFAKSVRTNCICTKPTNSSFFKPLFRTKAFFCSFSLLTVMVCDIFGEIILAQKLLVKCWWNWHLGFCPCRSHGVSGRWIVQHSGEGISHSLHQIAGTSVIWNWRLILQFKTLVYFSSLKFMLPKFW